MGVQKLQKIGGLYCTCCCIIVDCWFANLANKEVWKNCVLCWFWIITALKSWSLLFSWLDVLAAGFSFLCLGGTPTKSLNSSYFVSSPTPADFFSMIWSVHSSRCRELYLLIVPFFSNSLTRSQWMSFCRSLVDFFASLGPVIAAASSRSLASSSSSSTCLDAVEKGRHLFFVLDEPLAPESNKRYYMTTRRYWGGRTCYFHMWRYVFAQKPTFSLSTNFCITLHFIQKWPLLHHFSGWRGGWWERQGILLPYCMCDYRLLLGQYYLAIICCVTG